jgi:hypothetical protein
MAKSKILKITERYQRFYRRPKGDDGARGALSEFMEDVA